MLVSYGFLCFMFLHEWYLQNNSVAAVLVMAARLPTNRSSENVRWFGQNC